MNVEELVTEVVTIELVNLVVVEVIIGIEVEVVIEEVVGMEVVGSGIEVVDSETVVEVMVVNNKVVIGTGMEVVDSEIEVSVVVGNDRTEVVGTGAEDSGIESDVVSDNRVVVGTEVVEENSDMEVDIEIAVVGTMETVGFKMEVRVAEGNRGVEVVGIGMEAAIDDDPGIEIDVVIGTTVFVGTGTEVEKSIVEVEAGIVDTRMELVGIAEDKDKLVGCGEETGVVLIDTVELSTAEKVITREDGNTKLELGVGVVVVGGGGGGGVGGVPQNWYSHEIEYVPASLVINIC